ncbi:FUSC family protein [Paenibacillus durus]|uniref:FUSC family protein n=1 Tax=Paenibacillus durus TaxID=44251 RepID=UPI0004716AE8|nr:FUSC family protein [Paenibacillus durus]
MNEGLQERLEKFGFSLYMIRVTLAASLSWMAVHAMYGNEFSYFAPLAAILITQGSVKASLEKGIYRLLGIVLGGTVSLMIGHFFNVGPLSILLILLIGLGVATACRINFQAITQVGVTSVLALTFLQDHYVMFRATETLIGVAFALLFNVIIVPPKGFVNVKNTAFAGTLLLADGLNGLAPGRDENSQAEALKRSGQLLKDSAQKQSELLFTLSHVPCINDLSVMKKSISHLQTMHNYVKEISAEIRLLPPHYASADWMQKTLSATADCIAIFGAKTLSDTECHSSLPEALRRARELQLASFSELQGNCPLTAIRDLGAVFSHLNRLLDEVERADHAVMSAAPQRTRARLERAVRFAKKGLSHKL